MTFDRETVALLLLQHVPRLHFQVEAGPAAFTYRLEREGQWYTACVLVRSSDYWRFRLHLTNPHISMLVCLLHDSCVPMPVQSLGDGYFYTPYETPSWYQLEASRFTSKTAPVLLGQLLCGVQAAYERLQAFTCPRTRSRYLARLHEYSQHKQGRPVQA